MRPSMRARRGFTLIELSIVMAIMAIAAAVVVPQLADPNFGFGAVQPAMPGDQLTSLLRDSRRLALQYGQTVTVHLDPTSGMYEVDTTGAYGTGVYVASTLAMGAFESMSTDLQRLKFVFRPDGVTFGDTVVVHGSNGSLMIMADPWSGVVVPNLWR